jgi:hypothetical protein
MRERLHALGTQKEKLEVEPDAAVVARLEKEVAFSLRKKLRDPRLHLAAAYPAAPRRREPARRSYSTMLKA